MWLILVPGDAGSQVEAKLDKHCVVNELCDQKTNRFGNIWLNLEYLGAVIIDCLVSIDLDFFTYFEFDSFQFNLVIQVDNLKLTYDKATHTTKNSPGVELRIPGWGNSSVVENVDPTLTPFGAYFDVIAETLACAGLKRDFSIRGAPYDFRKSPST